MNTYDVEDWESDLDDYTLKLPVRVNDFIPLLW